MARGHGHTNAHRGRAGPTITWEMARTNAAPTEDPVQAVKLIAGGPIYFLDRYRWEERPRRWLAVGAGPDQDIVIDDPTVSKMHCILRRNRNTGRLYVEDAASKNGLWVNDVLVLDGKVELASGNLLSLGGAVLLACGRAGEAQRPTLSGANLHVILERAIAVYGSQRNAAKALAIKQPTYSRWLEKQKFLPA